MEKQKESVMNFFQEMWGKYRPLTVVGLMLSVMIIICLICSCTYSIALIHTNGRATDLIDESNAPVATVSLPIKQ